MSFIRGVVLAGKFRTHHQLNTMSAADQRNTLITELVGHTNQPVTHFQAMNDDTLAGTGAVLDFIRTGQIRTDQQLKTMSDDDQRNTLIVEINGQTGIDGHQLQGMSNLELVLLGLGKPLPGGLTMGSFIRGVLLAGRFRTHHELNKMTQDNMRNTLIVELGKRTRESGAQLQALNDFDLAGAGALLVFMREAAIRADSEIKTMRVDDMRNTAIVEIDGQTHLGGKLQSLRNMDLIRLALGVNPAIIFKPLPGPLLPQAMRTVFRINSFEMRTQKSDGDHSDSDWLSLIITVVNTNTKNSQTFSGGTRQIGGSIKSGTTMVGPFDSVDIDAGDADIVVVNYLVTNLGSSDAEAQFAQAVKITDKVVEVVAPIAGAVIAAIFGGDPATGKEIGEGIAKGLDTAVKVLGEVFDFFGVHFGPPNCNGEVLKDTLTYQPNELKAALGIPSSKEYTGPQENDRCGAAPVTKVNFMLFDHPF